MDSLALSLVDGDVLSLTLSEALSEVLGLADSLDDSEALSEADALVEGEALSLALSEVLGLNDSLADSLVDGEPDSDVDGEEDSLVLPLALSEADSDALGLADAEVEGDELALVDGEALALALSEADGEVLQIVFEMVRVSIVTRECAGTDTLDMMMSESDAPTDPSQTAVPPLVTARAHDTLPPAGALVSAVKVFAVAVPPTAALKAVEENSNSASKVCVPTAVLGPAGCVPS